jgi:hypothetical protein
MREFIFQTLDDPIVQNYNPRALYTVKSNRLFQEQFVTYKKIRKDKDWQMDETVIVTLSPVAKPHTQLGTAKIIGIDKKSTNHYIYPETTDVSGDERRYEGLDLFDGWNFRRKYFGDDYHEVETFNKITLQWVTWNINMIKIALERGEFRL